MKPDDLLDYALGQLEGHPLAVLETELGRDLARQTQADRLSQALALLLDDGDDAFDPPPGLAERTVAFVVDQVQAPRRAILEFAPRRVPFRWADLAVAAGILVAGTLTLLPAIRSGRDQMNQAACAYNLRELGTNLAQYALRYRHYPKVSEPNANNLVGKYATDLQGEALLSDSKTLHCPCVANCPSDTLRTNPRHMDFAYNVGYLNAAGRTEPITPWLASAVPLLADQPAHDGHGQILAGNSPNHGRRGQNVLFSDLHFRWLPTRSVGPTDSDLFLNEQHQPRPGVTVRDAAVIPASFHVTPTR